MLTTRPGQYGRRDAVVTARPANRYIAGHIVLHAHGPVYVDYVPVASAAHMPTVNLCGYNNRLTAGLISTLWPTIVASGCSYRSEIISSIAATIDGGAAPGTVVNSTGITPSADVIVAGLIGTNCADAQSLSGVHA